MENETWKPGQNELCRMVYTRRRCAEHVFLCTTWDLYVSWHCCEKSSYCICSHWTFIAVTWISSISRTSCLISSDAILFYQLPSLSHLPFSIYFTTFLRGRFLLFQSLSQFSIALLDLQLYCSQFIVLKLYPNWRENGWV